MPKTIIDNEGNEIEVFTQEELEEQKKAIEDEYKKQLEDKDAHIQEKLNQLKNKEAGINNAESEAIKKAEEAKILAEQLQEKMTETEKVKNETVKKFWITQTAGGDEELVTKLNEAYDLINIEIKSDEDIARRVQLATQMVGIKSIEIPSNPFVGGFVAPQPKESSVDQASYDDFKKSFGL